MNRPRERELRKRTHAHGHVTPVAGRGGIDDHESAGNHGTSGSAPSHSPLGLAPGLTHVKTCLVGRHPSRATRTARSSMRQGFARVLAMRGPSSDGRPWDVLLLLWPAPTLSRRPAATSLTHLYPHGSSTLVHERCTCCAAPPLHWRIAVHDMHIPPTSCCSGGSTPNCAYLCLVSQ